MNTILFLAIIITFIYIWATAYLLTPIRNLIDITPIINLINKCPSCLTWWVTLFVCQIYNPLLYFNNIFDDVILSAFGYVLMDILMSITSNKKSGCQGGCGG